MALKTLLLLILTIQSVLSGTSPYLPDNLSLEDDTIPLDASSLPQEILDQLEAGEIVEEIVVVEDDKKQIIDLRNEPISADPISIQPDEEKTLMSELYEEVLANLEETPRSVENNEILRALEEDRQGDFFENNNLSRQQLLQFLSNTQNLQDTVPLNRKGLTEEKVEDITRKFIVDRNNIPGTELENGIRCIPKLVQIDETVYDRGMKCHHSYQNKCHMTYITDYASSNEQRCDTTFKKSCHITFKPVPHSEKVNVCHTPLVRKCGDEIEGPEICSTQYEDNCETKYKTYELNQDEPDCKMEETVRCTNVTVELFHIHDDNKHIQEDASPFAVREKCEKWPTQKCTLEKKRVTKVHPETACRKIPKSFCIPNNCIAVKGDEVCNEETRTQVQNLPEEECDLQPEQNCRMESTLVPRLVPKKNCLKVPKEICVNTKRNPHVIKKHILKNWCYKPEDLEKDVNDF
ncbi:uncharacterized protein [Lepeophtheirus salmonis]|uniref:uncharacterized protein n=1 Tax=Lepeophtheirus salmonis TaxID=72036 RepID=UPI001AE562A5|nr:uncharacterized protein LOC121115766 [Lepeophtheirus salmonis]